MRCISLNGSIKVSNHVMFHPTKSAIWPSISDPPVQGDLSSLGEGYSLVAVSSYSCTILSSGRKGLDRARCRVACTHTPRTRPPLKSHAKDCTGQTTFAHGEYQHHQLRDPSSAPLIRSPPGPARDPGASGHGWLKRRKRKQARVKSMVSSNRPLHW